VYKVKLDITAKLHGCPGGGLPAIDWRKSAGLPPEPTCDVRLKWEGESEWLVRTFPELADDDADITVETGTPDHARYTLCGTGTKYGLLRNPAFHGDYAKIDGSRIPPQYAKPFLGVHGMTPAEGDVAAILRVLLDQAAEGEARREREHEERLKADAEERARREREYAETRQREAAEKAAKLARLRGWAEVHGSPLTKARLAEGFASWVASANDEFADSVVAHLPPEFAEAVDPEGTSCTRDDERQSPTLAELRALKLARAALADLPAEVSLRYERYDADEAEYIVGEDAPEPTYRTELRVVVTAPHGATQWRYFLIPEAAPAEPTGT
jgi:hypothetical protein